MLRWDGTYKTVLRSQLCRALYCGNDSDFLRVTDFFSLCECSRVQNPSSSNGDMDAIQGQQAACNNQKGTMGVHSSSSTTISEGGVCRKKSIWLCNGPVAEFPLRALLVAPKGNWPTSGLQPVKLPRLARPNGCFAAYDLRSIGELSGRTTGRLRDISPEKAHATGWTAELALLYCTNLRILRRTQALLSDD